MGRGIALTDGEQRPCQDEVAGAVRAVDRMVRVVDDLETYVWTTHWRDVRGIRYRLNLLWLHALAALLTAPLLSATGRAGLSGPSFAFLRALPGTPYSLATVLGLGGLILGLGCVFRAKRVEMVGLALLGVFYLTLAVSFAVPPLRWLTAGGHDVKPPMYAPVVYGHLCIIMIAHITGLIHARNDLAAVTAIATAAQHRQPDPAGPHQPGPHQPGPLEPGPLEPGPHQPGPHQPGPHQPGSLEAGQAT